MPTDTTSLKRSSANTRQVSPLRSLTMPKMPEKLRKIDPEGSAAFDLQVQQLFSQLIGQLEDIRNQIRD